MSNSRMPRAAQRAVIATMAALGAATVVFALLAIWNADGRWGWTALVSGALAFMALFALVIDETPTRSGSR